MQISVANHPVCDSHPHYLRFLDPTRNKRHLTDVLGGPSYLHHDKGDTQVSYPYPGQLRASSYKDGVFVCGIYKV